ncbi:hypothetical protein HanRHA438_Chr08g0355771 [Helianthus annuus]|nr:hypothetical protein HanRHA438_Chr08g0355771 [Helianthus annuus]
MELHIPLSLIIFILTFFYLFTKLKTSTSPNTIAGALNKLTVPNHNRKRNYGLGFQL